MEREAFSRISMEREAVSRAGIAAGVSRSLKGSRYIA
jgi:hypothetical protein